MKREEEKLNIRAESEIILGKIRTKNEERDDLKLQMSVLFGMSRAISNYVDLDMLLDVILDKAILLMNAKFCTLQLLDRSRKRLSAVSCTGIDEKKLKKFAQFENDVGKKVIKENISCVINDTRKSSAYKIPGYLKDNGIRSILAVPLFSGKRRSGVLTAYLSRPRAFSKEGIEMFEMVAILCSMAIDNATMLSRIRKDYLNTIKTLAKIIDANDKYTRGHCDKVMRYSLIICKKLKIPRHNINSIKTASLLHDIGKIGIDLSLINKKGKLTNKDWEKMRMHPEIGSKIVNQAGFLSDIASIILHHHERFKGGGYPDSERHGKTIPLGARIIAVADAFDAMTSDRPYRKAMSQEEAMNELRRCSGSQFDPNVVSAFASNFN